MARCTLSKSEKAAKKLYVPPEKVDECIKEREAAEKEYEEKRNQGSDEFCLLTEKVIRGAYKIERGGK